MEQEMAASGDRSKEEEMAVNGNCSAEKVMAGGASTPDLESGDNLLDVYAGKRDVEDQDAPVDRSCLPSDDRHASSSSTLVEVGSPSSGSDRGEVGGDAATSTSGGEIYPHLPGTKANNLKKSLFFEGSVMEAIALSKQLNKMFVVYIARSDNDINALNALNGNDNFSLLLDSPRATAVLLRSCCVLQLLQNSVDAKQFSSIYPVRIFPTVAVIGLQGTLLAWIEGDNVVGDELATKLEEAESTFSSQVNSLAASAAAMAAALLAASGGLGGVPPPPPQAGAQLPGQDEQHALSSPLNNSDLPSPPPPTTDIASSLREATSITLTSTQSELPGLQPLELSGGSASQSLAIERPDNLFPADTLVFASTAEAIDTENSETEAAVVLTTTDVACRPDRAAGEWQSPAVEEGREMGEGGKARTSCLPHPPSAPPLMEVDKLTPSCSQGADSEQHAGGDNLPSSSLKSVNDEEDATASVDHRTFGRQEASANKSPEEEPCMTMSAAAENQKNQNNEASASSGPPGLPPNVHETPMAPSRVHLETQGTSNGRGSNSLAPSASSMLIDTWKKAQIQFRLTDGSSLKGEFGADDKLVKAWDFIAEEGGEKRQSFAMMIPFPRRVLGQDDMEKTFRELELVPRATIILTPIAGKMPSRQQAVPSMVGGVARGVGERDGSGDAGPSGGGHVAGGTAASGLLGTVFWGVGRGVGRILSYFNPFSYLWGGEHNGGAHGGSEGGRQQEGWEYQPNPTLERVIRNGGRQGGAGGGEARISRDGAGFLPGAAVAGGQHGDLVRRRPSDSVRNHSIQRDMPDATTDTSTGAAAGSAGTTQRRGGAGWGANVHVLRQSEDDFHGGNAFWNGNSTQFGADGDGRGGSGGM